MPIENSHFDIAQKWQVFNIFFFEKLLDMNYGAVGAFVALPWYTNSLVLEYNRREMRWVFETITRAQINQQSFQFYGSKMDLSFS